MDTKTIDLFAKSATAGAIGYAVSIADNSFLLEGKVGSVGYVTLFGKQLPFPLAMALSLFVSNLVAELAHSFILPAIHVSERWGNMVSSGLAIGATYAAAHILLSQASPGLLKAIGPVNLLLICGVTESVSQYVYQNFVSSMLIQ